MSDNDDVSTIVLDFNNIKSQLDEKEDIIEDEATLHDLAFSTDMLNETKEEPKQVEIEEEEEVALEALSKKKIFLLAYKTEFFAKRDKIFSGLHECSIITAIKDLNKNITEFPDAIFIMYFNDTPKAVNQISEQIKRKFPKASSVIIAKNLSAAKAKQHQDSKYGANAYLNEPFTKEVLESKLSELY